jgi:hypothetical protein
MPKIDLVFFLGVLGPMVVFTTYLCTYDLYSPVHNVLDACISSTSGRELGPGIPEFFGPCEMASSRERVPFGDQKNRVTADHILLANQDRNIGMMP